MKKYKMKDLENGDTWYFDSTSEMKNTAYNYTNDCEGDWIPEFRILNPLTEKYRKMTEDEIKAAYLPR